MLAIAVMGVIAHQARSLNWAEIGEALRSYPVSTLATTLIFPVAGFLMFSCYDLFARKVLDLKIPPLRVMRIGFIAYAFTLNIGTLLGGLALRYRLYGRDGVSTTQVSQITALAVVTNWSGYLLLAGALFLFDPPAMPQAWNMSTGWLRVIGGVMLTLIAVFLAVSTISRERPWKIRDVEFSPLPISYAALQIAMSSIAWTMMALALHHLMPPEVPFGSVMTGFFIAAVAGLVLRVPGGLGVLEGVLVVLLRDFASVSTILAATLAYRASYLFLPLLLAIGMFAIEELRRPRRAQSINDTARAVPGEA